MRCSGVSAACCSGTSALRGTPRATPLTSQAQLHPLDVKISRANLDIPRVNGHRGEAHLQIESPCLFIAYSHRQNEILYTCDCTCPVNGLLQECLANTSPAWFGQNIHAADTRPMPNLQALPATKAQNA